MRSFMQNPRGRRLAASRSAQGERRREAGEVSRSGPSPQVRAPHGTRTKVARFAVVVSLAILLASPSAASALYYPTAYYNSIAWTWAYDATWTSLYNCLGYATGSMIWEWPWGGNPPSSTVDSYLASKGYVKSYYPYQPRIISYGTTSGIRHFSRVPAGTSNTSVAKWGGLERMKSASRDPYYSSSYGYWVAMYR